MQIALLQFNPVVGDLEGNARQILAQLNQAAAQGAQLAVCSELSLLGYPPRDLLERPGFVAAAQRWTAWLVEQTTDVALIFGSIGVPSNQHFAPGSLVHRLTNDAVVAQGGRELGRAHKQLLPNYDVFDERRHFRPGESRLTLTLAGKRCTLSICEDAWAREPGMDQVYARDPLADVSPANSDVLINLSASPFTLAKLEQRPRLFSELARRTGVPVVMVNQVGGNDELIFDGRSAVFDAQGQLLAQAKMFEPELLLVDTQQRPETRGGEVEPVFAATQRALGTDHGDPEAAAAYRALVLGVRDYLSKCGFRRAVLGLSGGIDSALVATIAADALGRDAVLGVAMPTRYSSDHSQSDALELARALGIQFEHIDIDPIFATYLQHLQPRVDKLGAAAANDVTWENVQARIRGATIMAISNRTGAIPLTTGNKSEIAVGYCTLYGDMVGGLAVISDVPKTMVYRLSRYANAVSPRIPESTLTKPPSAELRPDQKDEDSLPPYDVLDQVLEHYVEDMKSPAQLVAMGFAVPLVERVVKLVRTAEYKRKQAAPGLIITRKAFGSGRRIPVAQGYREDVVE